MNFQKALDWCVENVDVWPDDLYCQAPKDFAWDHDVLSFILLYGMHGGEIFKQNWLDAKAKKDKDVKAIDWNNAPEGATHSYIGNDSIHKGYYKRDKLCAYKWCYTLWMAYTNDMQWFEDKCRLISVDNQQENELPTVCVGVVYQIAESSDDCSHNEPVGHQVKIYSKFTDDRGIELFAYVDSLGVVGGIATAKLFRPIKTEREKGIEALTAILAKGVGDCEPDEYLAAQVYDAGYRKHD